MFDIVLSDPPWSYYGQQDKWGAAAKFYSTVEDYNLIELARPPLNDPGILFMWTTSAKLAVAIHLIEEWDLYYRGVAFIWVKTKRDGTAIGAQGVRPSITKPLTELVVSASTREKGRPLKLHDESIEQTVFAPRTEHSRKPGAIHTRIEFMYPEASKLEMFSRESRDGWATHGNEQGKFDR